MKPDISKFVLVKRYRYYLKSVLPKKVRGVSPEIIHDMFVGFMADNRRDSIILGLGLDGKVPLNQTEVSRAISEKIGGYYSRNRIKTMHEEFIRKLPYLSKNPKIFIQRAQNLLAILNYLFPESPNSQKKITKNKTAQKINAK